MARELHAASRRRSRFDFDASDGRQSGVADVDHAGAEECLHLQILVVVVEHGRVHIDPPVGHRALQASFIAPRELGLKGPAGRRRRGVESAALEAPCGRKVDERLRRRLELDARLWCPGVVGGPVHEVIERRRIGEDRRVQLVHPAGAVDILLLVRIPDAARQRQAARQAISRLAEQRPGPGVDRREGSDLNPRDRTA